MPLFFLLIPRLPTSTLFPYTTLFRSDRPIRLVTAASAPPPSVIEGLESLDITRSEEHTSELQSRGHLVCRLLLEKKKKPDREKDTKRTTRGQTGRHTQGITAPTKRHG